MHHYGQLEALATDRIRRPLAEPEGSRLAHGARVGSRAVRTTRGGAGSKKVQVPVLRVSPSRSTSDTPTIRFQRRTS